MTRQFWVRVHRYAGLFMAVFLVIIGMTGSVIVFNPELYSWFDPQPKVATRSVLMLDAYSLRERAQALVPYGMVNALTFHRKADEPYVAGIEPRIDPVTGQPYELIATVLLLDPYTGAELKRDKFTGDLWPVTQKNIVPLINRLHYQMALPGSVGIYLFGIVALVWTVDCAVGAYLTFPVSTRRRKDGEASATNARRRRWIARWWNPAWLVKWSGSAYRINFDLHRAGGLWVWIMLLALAWSSVGFNLGEEVYIPVMKTVFDMPDPYGANAPKLDIPRPDPALDWRAAHAIAQRLMAEQAKTSGFAVLYEDMLMYQADKGAFLYIVRSDRDLLDEGASTTLLFDEKGTRLSLSLPTGKNAGSTIHSWIFALHMAKIWGLPFRLFVSVMGLVVAMLSVTGVYIWWIKRGARRLNEQRRASPLAMAPEGDT